MGTIEKKKREVTLRRSISLVIKRPRFEARLVPWSYCCCVVIIINVVVAVNVVSAVAGGDVEHGGGGSFVDARLIVSTICMKSFRLGLDLALLLVCC